jgi:hypothetical protein
VDKETTELVKAATEGGVRAFLETIAGPLVESSAWATDLIRRQRVKVQIRTLTLARQMLETAGLAPGAVPAKQLVPLLELASLEEPEDEEMQARWAALLANAAADGETPDVWPSFPRILSELSPVEAQLLDGLAAQEDGAQILEAFLEVAGLPLTDGRPEQYPYGVYVDNLERLQVIRVLRPDRALQALARKVSDRPTMMNNWTYVHLTALGRAFVAACSPPRPS